MSEREPRKRKKRKENQKKEDLNAEEITFTSKKPHEEWQKDSEPEPDEELISHEPSVVAKIIFFVIFSLLIIATGVVFIALHNADRSIGIISDMDTSHSEIPVPDIPITYTDSWKPEDTKEGKDEPELWVEELSDKEQLPIEEILPEEEILQPTEEILQTEYYTPIIPEEMTESVKYEEENAEESQPIYHEEMISDERSDNENNAHISDEPFEFVYTSEMPSIETESLSIETEELINKEHLETNTENVQTINIEEAKSDDANSENIAEFEPYEIPTSKDYEKADITNEEDYHIKNDLDEIDRLIDKEPEEDDISFWF